ncbi:MAG: hypothetical protein ACOH2V_00155 [Candidatus Saccharimonadaceae bacterium]
MAHNHTLDSLSNTTITSNTNGEILKWDGTAWVNNTLSEAGIEPSFLKNTAFNKNFGTATGTVSEGNHTHAYEPIITAGITAQYWRGDKTWVAFPTIPSIAGLISLTSLSATAPILYSNTTGVFSMSTNAYAPYGTVSFPGFGTTHTTAAYGDHMHATIYDKYDAWLFSIAGGTIVDINSKNNIAYNGIDIFTEAGSGISLAGASLMSGLMRVTITNTAPFPGFGTTSTTAAYGDHTHAEYDYYNH